MAAVDPLRARNWDTFVFFSLHLLHSINSVDTEAKINKLAKLVAFKGTVCRNTV